MIRRGIQFVRDERVRITRYLLSGISAVAADAGLYFMLTRGYDVYFLTANIISVLCGGTVAFLLNKYWSFEVHHNTLQQSHRFATLFVANYLFQQVSLYVLHGLWGVPDALAKLGLIGVSTIWNFLLYRYWIYGIQRTS